MPVVALAPEPAECQDCPVLPGHEPVGIGLEQQFRPQKTQLTEDVHLEKLGIVLHLFPVQCHQVRP